ncbi:hypothetical protein [Escherichia coli]|uniref:hypothetical protein n=1 Tax=Escherichia coli TaxID=562 RepID=UPI000B7E56F3|nr:hypothetical protein [Escherichia coli]EFA4748362.1 hypothetical protein [Escherichia coli]EJN3746978.1 hypothetical protein [Escherichia coli]EJN3790128.1 hypothetical protein [Escherichia coli]EKG6904384.1 hypothetical protein [Escherichia coli]SQM16892.1 Uncharacterised protein [Escherichia coli]
MAESGYGLAGLGMGKVKSINPYRLTPGFGGFTPVSYATTEYRLPYRWRGIKNPFFLGDLCTQCVFSFIDEI